MIRIGIVDDHYILTEGLKNLMECDKDFNVVFQAQSGKECLEFLAKAENTIDILLLDISMPGLSGYEVLEKIKKEYFHIRTIFFTFYNDYSHFSRAMDLGVDGYILKNIDFSELTIALKDIANGLVYIDKNMDSLLKRYVSGTDSSETLTKREREIMYCVASGMMNKEIAIDLKIREETVKNHLTRIFDKFKVNDRTQAVVYAIKNNMIDL